MDSLKNAFLDLTNKLNKATKEADNYRNAITELRKICEHDWIEVGHDSHKSHYKCSICGELEEW